VFFPYALWIAVPLPLKWRSMGVKSVFGANLKLYSKAKRLSQKQLSEKANISVKHLSYIERGMNFVSADLLENVSSTG